MLDVDNIASDRNSSADADAQHRLARITAFAVGLLAALGGLTLALSRLTHPTGLLPIPAAGTTYTAAMRREILKYEGAVADRRFREARDHLAQARDLAERAQSRAPANGVLWAARAEIEWRQNGLTDLARSFSTQSRRFALHEYTAVGIRVHVGLHAFENLSEAERDHLAYDVETLLVVPAKHRIVETLAGLASAAPPEGTAWLQSAVARLAPSYVRQFELNLAEKRSARR